MKVEQGDLDAAGASELAAPPNDTTPPRLGDAVVRAASAAQDLEHLTRPLLEALSKVAALESTYLMVFDWDRHEQEVLYAYNARGVTVTEGIRIRCPPGLSPEAFPGVTRSLEDLTDNHPDSQVAKDLGLRAYVSVPVVVARHRLWGMLCGASPAPSEVSETVISVMEFLALLIADHVIRQQTAAAEHRAEAAEDRLRTRAMFLARAEHLLKSPLTVVLGMSRMLRRHWETLPTGERENLLSTLEANAETLSRQVEDLLVEARSEVRARDLAPFALELSDLLPTIARAFDAVSETHHVVAEESSDIMVMADPSALYQVLGHLLDNAVKYSPNGSTVRLHVRKVDREVVIEVTDEGVGVPEDVDVFAPFVRGSIEATAGATVPGLGLGLHIVRNLVEAMGGSVTVRPEPRGSTFVVRLPAAS